MYRAVFGGQDTETTVLLKLENQQTFRIVYLLPGDRIGRSRYEKVFGAILKSLQIKTAS